MKEGPCIGGFTKASWEEDSYDIIANDKDAFLFNLTYRRQFPIKKPEAAIKRVPEWGPNFGEGELAAWDEPFNSPLNGVSMLDEGSYDIEINEDGKNPLTNI